MHATPLPIHACLHAYGWLPRLGSLTWPAASRSGDAAARLGARACERRSACMHGPMRSCSMAFGARSRLDLLFGTCTHSPHLTRRRARVSVAFGAHAVQHGTAVTIWPSCTHLTHWWAPLLRHRHCYMHACMHSIAPAPLGLHGFWLAFMSIGTATRCCVPRDDGCSGQLAGSFSASWVCVSSPQLEDGVWCPRRCTWVHAPAPHRLVTATRRRQRRRRQPAHCCRVVMRCAQRSECLQHRTRTVGFGQPGIRLQHLTRA